MANWLYIVGRGHSGTTVLDCMLGNSRQIESIGELVSGMSRYGDLCSCGKTFSDCEYWQQVRQNYDRRSVESWIDSAYLSVSQAHIRRFPATLFASESTAWVRRLSQSTELICNSVASVKGSQVVLDSSKEATRALFLMRFARDCRVIHLVRHPASILASNYKRLAGGSGFKFLRRRFYPKRIFWPALFASAVGWVVGNCLAEIVRMFGKGRFLRVRYEDLVSDPKVEFARIEEFLGVTMKDVLEKIESSDSFEIGHNIGGNHMRMSGTFRFRPQSSGKTELPTRFHVMVFIVCLPVLWLYGYGYHGRRRRSV